MRGLSPSCAGESIVEFGPIRTGSEDWLQPTTAASIVRRELIGHFAWSFCDFLRFAQGEYNRSRRKAERIGSPRIAKKVSEDKVLDVELRETQQVAVSRVP